MSGPTLKRQVLELLTEAGGEGATDQELAAALNAAPVSIRTQRVALVRAGRVRMAAKQRETEKGFKAQVWVKA